MLKRPGCVSRVRVRAERRLAEAHVDRVVEPLHPDRHLRSAPGARPPVGQPMERLPETPPETDLDGPRDRTFGAYVTRYDGMHGSARIRWNLPLLQRGRYSVAPDKEADARFRASENTTDSQVGGHRVCEFGQQLFVRASRFQRREETEGTTSEGFSTQGEALPPRWAEGPASLA